jgi:hypothetical protein
MGLLLRNLDANMSKESDAETSVIGGCQGC